MSAHPLKIKLLDFGGIFISQLFKTNQATSWSNLEDSFTTKN